MPKQIPHTTKTTAVKLYVGGQSCEAVAAALEISPSSVTSWVRQAGHKVRPSRSSNHEVTNGSLTRLDPKRWVRDGLVWKYEADDVA